MKRAALLSSMMLAGCMPVARLGVVPGPVTSRPHARGPAFAKVPVPLESPLSAGASIDRHQPTFAAAIRAAGLAPQLAGTSQVTVFAPGEDAWANLAPGILVDLLRPENRQSLAALLRFHVVPGRLTAADLRRRAALGPLRIQTLGGGLLTVTVAGGALMLSDGSGHRAYVTMPDEPASNGIVHEVNGLLIPQTLGPQP